LEATLGNVLVLLFRGINVGGNKVVRMEALRKALSDAGFGEVATYIQSGNVVITADDNEEAIQSRVEAIFSEQFGFSSRPTVRSLERWRQVVGGNPFGDAAAEDGRRVHAVLLDGEPDEAALQELEALAGTERMAKAKGVLYLHTPDGFGISKVAESLDKVLKVPLTARNWNTVLKLSEMAEGATQRA
jgi:uncharacterized protein (DUF1697 family)